MRPPKTTAEPVCLWLSRLLMGVGACFDFVGTSERLSYMDDVSSMVRTIRKSSMEGVWRVVRVCPCRVYIDSNHRDSQI
jgi:hypothetical protein